MSSTTRTHILGGATSCDKSREPHKSPGLDGMCLEFFKTARDMIKNDLLQIINLMYIEEKLTTRQLQGLTVCLPKKTNSKYVEDYRPLTLLNTDYKILAPITANRLRTYMTEILHPKKYCGLQGNSAFDAVAAIRETVAFAEITRTTLCIVSIDCSSAFDNISYSYLMSMFNAHGFSDWIQQRIMGMYNVAASEVQINGFRSSPIQINISVRQGCPLSMQSFALCLNLFIQTLEKELQGIKIGRGQPKTAVTAYADDVTIFLSTPDDIGKLHDILNTYEAATGAMVNMTKSRALALGTWDTPLKIMDIPCHTGVQILGYHFTNKVNTSAKETWSMVTEKVRALAIGNLLQKSELE